MSRWCRSIHLSVVQSTLNVVQFLLKQSDKDHSFCNSLSNVLQSTYLSWIVCIRASIASISMSHALSPIVVILPRWSKAVVRNWSLLLGPDKFISCQELPLLGRWPLRQHILLSLMGKLTGLEDRVEERVSGYSFEHDSSIWFEKVVVKVIEYYQYPSPDFCFPYCYGT